MEYMEQVKVAYRICQYCQDKVEMTVISEDTHFGVELHKCTQCGEINEYWKEKYKLIQSTINGEYWQQYMDLNILYQYDLQTVKQAFNKGELFFAISSLRERNINKNQMLFAEFIELFNNDRKKALERMFWHPIKQWELDRLDMEYKKDKYLLKRLYNYHKQYPYWLLGTFLTAPKLLSEEVI